MEELPKWEGSEHHPLLPHYSVLKRKLNAKLWTPIWRWGRGVQVFDCERELSKDEGMREGCDHDRSRTHRG
jgi:hypothetical protein